MSVSLEQPMRPYLKALGTGLDNTDASLAQLAQDLQALDGELDDIPLEYVRTYDNVAEMQADDNLLSGMTCHTNGFHASGDGGAAYYTVGASGTANGMDVLALQGGLFATLVLTEPYVTPEMFGAVGNGETNDFPAFDRLKSVARQVVGNKDKTYCFATGSSLTLEDIQFDSVNILLNESTRYKESIFLLGDCSFYNCNVSGGMVAFEIANADNVLFDGCTLANKQTDITARAYSIADIATCGTVTIVNCNFPLNYVDGVAGVAKIYLAPGLVWDNALTDAMLAKKGKSAVIKNCQFMGIVGSNSRNVMIDNFEYAEISGCYFTAGDSTTLATGDLAGFDLVRHGYVGNNTFINTGENCFDCLSSHNVLIENNHMENHNTSSAIMIDCWISDFAATFGNNSSYDFKESNIKIVNNSIEGWVWSAIRVAPSRGLVVSGNTFIYNEVNGTQANNYLLGLEYNENELVGQLMDDQFDGIAISDNCIIDSYAYAADKTYIYWGAIKSFPKNMVNDGSIANYKIVSMSKGDSDRMFTHAGKYNHGEPYMKGASGKLYPTFPVKHHLYNSGNYSADYDVQLQSYGISEAIATQISTSNSTGLYIPEKGTVSLGPVRSDVGWSDLPYNATTYTANIIWKLY